MAELTIEDYKKQYEAAKAAGDAAGMQAANDGANALRAAQGIAPEYAAGDIASVAAQQSAAASAPQQAVPAGFTGSASGVSTYTTDQQAIKNQMNANSQAWYGASAGEQARLHAENEYLASLLGGGVAYDPAAGTWSGAADAQAPTGGDLTAMVEDYSPYLQQMYDAQKTSALAQLRAAYEQNVAAIDRAGEGVSGQYQAARNSTAGAGELAKRNFAEYAAASGLNSGTGGQAELARNVTLQNNLNSIDTAQADAIADLELQRAQAEIEYNNAIAQAEADGDYALASALYQEKVRVQSAMINAAIQEYQNAVTSYQLGYQAQRDQISDSQWQRSFDLQQQQYAAGQAASRQSALAEYGNAFMQQGLMPSAEMLAAMGITQTDAQAYTAAVRAQQAASSSGSGSSGGSGSSSGGSSGGSSGSSGTADYEGLFTAALESGYPKSYIANNYKSYGFTSSTGLYDEYQAWAEGGSAGSSGYNDAYFTAAMRSVAAGLAQGNEASVFPALDSLWGKLSQAQKQTVQELLARYGYQYTGG